MPTTSSGYPQFLFLVSGGSASSTPSLPQKVKDQLKSSAWKSLNTSVYPILPEDGSRLNKPNSNLNQNTRAAKLRKKIQATSNSSDRYYTPISCLEYTDTESIEDLVVVALGGGGIHTLCLEDIVDYHRVYQAEKLLEWAEKYGGEYAEGLNHQGKLRKASRRSWRGLLGSREYPEFKEDKETITLAPSLVLALTDSPFVRADSTSIRDSDGVRKSHNYRYRKDFLSLTDLFKELISAKKTPTPPKFIPLPLGLANDLSPLSGLGPRRRQRPSLLHQFSRRSRVMRQKIHRAGKQKVNNRRE